MSGFLDKIKDAAGNNADKIEGALDKVGDVVDDKTGHKYSDKIDGAVDKAGDAIDKLDGDVDNP